MTTRNVLRLSFCTWMALACSQANGDLVHEFGTAVNNPGNAVGNTLTVMQTLMDGPVTFDAILSVVGSGDIHQTGGGTGVASGTGANAIGDGESLTFSMAIENVTSGYTVAFDGFDAIMFTGLQAGESATATWDGGGMASYPGQNPMGGQVVASYTAPLPKTLSITGGSDASFRISSIAGSFTVAAVPEAGPMLLGSLVCSLVGLAHFARRRRMEPVVEA